MPMDYDSSKWPKKGPSVDDVIVNIKDFWSKRRQGRRGFSIVVIIAILIWLASGIYMVSPREEGVVRRFGKLARSENMVRRFIGLVSRVFFLS